MRQSKVAQRYAKALFDLSAETGKIEEVRRDLELIRGTHHRELELLLVSPVVAGDKKTAVFEAVFAKHVQPLTVSFFKLIFIKGRSIAINEIIDAFIGKYREMKGIKVAEVTTALPLSNEAKVVIADQLKASAILKGKQIELKEKVDPSIIGGLVVQVDDQLFDASIRHDLQHIKRQFIKNMYVSQLK
jgi:F-type H+-transporting ATPase subunit delta